MMESDARCKNDLSRSYAECVERVAQQENDGGFNFELPKEVLEEREQVWRNFFHKYADEIPNEIELDMNTMKPVSTEEEEEHVDEGDDDEEDEEKKYYSKCRAPLRKLPALIQYWIDTGNPPYQLVGNDDRSETGSSLSEGEHSRSGHSGILRESNDKHKSNTSRCSSVDTAAYILSNTNITKKSETMAILEGAKSSDQHFAGKASPLKENFAESADITNNAIISSPNRGKKISQKIVQADTLSTLKISPELEKSSVTTPSKPPQTGCSIDLASKPLGVSSPNQQSVKLSEILPELQEFDEMLKRSTVINPPKVRSSLSKVRRKPKLVQSISPVVDALQSSQNSSVVPSCQSKSQNLRKLYTGRESPVDLVVERFNGDVVKLARRSSHPALDIAILQSNKAKRLTVRARSRRKRKRPSQVSQIKSQDNNASQETDHPIEEENLKGDVRYTNFFEALGLTPTNLVCEKASVEKPSTKKQIRRPIIPREAKNVPPVNDSMDSLQTEDWTSLLAEEVDNSIEKSKERIFVDKILSVRIDRLPDECLARYSRKVTSENAKNNEFKEKNSHTCNSSSSSSIDEKKRRLNSEKIELLENLTHDSDSSTILICSCNENGDSCDMDNFSGSKMPLKIDKLKLSTETVTDVGKSEITENLDKNLPDAFIKLEKLEINDSKKLMEIANNSRKKNKSEEIIPLKDSKSIINTSLSPQNRLEKSLDRNEMKNDSFTIRSKIFGELNSNDTAEKSRRSVGATRARCSLGILIISDDEEDCFAKLVSEIGLKRDSTKLEETNQEEKKKMNVVSKTQNLRNEEGRIRMEKPRKLFSISISSDEEDVYVRETKRRTKNLNFPNEKNRRERKNQNDFVKEVKNGEKTVKLNNQLDESNRRKFPNEKVVRDVEEMEVERWKTRSSKRRKKSKTKTFSPSEDEAEMKINENDTQGSNNAKRSTRHKLSASSTSKNQVTAKDSLTESKDTKNLFATLQTSDLTDVRGLRTSDNYDLGLNDEKFRAGRDSKIVGQSELSKSRTTANVERNERRIGNSMRFQTRLDSDSDTELKTFTYSLNNKHIQQNPRVRLNGGKIEKSNGNAVYDENEPEIEETEKIRDSPRRIFKTIMSERRRKNGERKLRKRRSLFDEESKSTEKIVDSPDNEAMDVEGSSNNRLLSFNDFSSKESKDYSVNPRKTKLKEESQENRGSRKNLMKFDRSKNRIPVANQRNEESRVSPLTKKKKVRRTRIFGNLIKWNSEDDTDSDEDQVCLRNAKQALEFPTNDDCLGQLSNKNAIVDSESSRKEQESIKSLFFSSFDKTIDHDDIIFNKYSRSRDPGNVTVIDKLNFTSTKKHKNLSKIELPTISFRTRLDNDGES